MLQDVRTEDPSTRRNTFQQFTRATRAELMLLASTRWLYFAFAAVVLAGVVSTALLEGPGSAGFIAPGYAAIAATVVGRSFSDGTIVSDLIASPRRGVLFTAKLAAALVAVTIGFGAQSLLTLPYIFDGTVTGVIYATAIGWALTALVTALFVGLTWITHRTSASVFIYVGVGLVGAFIAPYGLSLVGHFLAPIGAVMTLAPGATPLTPIGLVLSAGAILWFGHRALERLSL